MFSNSIALRSFAFNSGEEPFLAPGVAMATGMTCSASCVHCYLQDGEPDPVWVDATVWSAFVAGAVTRQASCLFLVNWEGIDLDLARRFLLAARRQAPQLPVVLKLGGHEDPTWVAALLEFVAAVSLDVKLFSEKVSNLVLGHADYPARCRELLRQTVAALGVFNPVHSAPCGVWLRHLILPVDAASWAQQLQEFLECFLPLWVLTGYRPCAKAAHIKGLERKLSADERQNACTIVAGWQQEGKLVWLT